MTVRLADGGVVELVGHCPSEDAETLLAELIARPDARVDWRACESAHTAVIQVLIAANVTPAGPPADGFLANRVEPLLNRR
ncbi:hypothetical protein [Phenylobacterium sp.]|uniref:hypothetical protein n=1 Tax=Phenylobacterium sp. TaxID=1871053 RepID=UPI001214C975|nr:hypothetical protein [Phenylobacterium sp.]THD62577.1 MAG: hypothetical protein E8A49_07315 [Phenylobacterium sp.]